MELVLASASPWRAELLKEVDFSFTIDPPNVREDIESYGYAPD
ncbi:septum formation inhibitor Maf, partial [candidate division TA06 bacterium]